MDPGGPYGWRQVASTEALVEIWERLIGFESMTWREILVSSREQNHRVGIHKLRPEAQARLEKIEQSDIDHLISLRISSRGRVWGILESRGVLALLWWDPEHQVYPSTKKDT